MYRESLQRSPWLKSPTTPAWAPCSNTQVSTLRIAARGKELFSDGGFIAEGRFASIFLRLPVCLFLACNTPPQIHWCLTSTASECPVCQSALSSLSAWLCPTSKLAFHCKVFSIYSKRHQSCSSNSKNSECYQAV